MQQADENPVLGRVTAIERTVDGNLTSDAPFKIGPSFNGQLQSRSVIVQPLGGQVQRNVTINVTLDVGSARISISGSQRRIGVFPDTRNIASAR